MLGYRVSASLFVFLFFFYLCKKRPPLKFIENYILVFGILYILLWLFAFSQLPTRIFGVGDETIEGTSRGMERINFTGRLSLILAYFLCLTRYFLTKKYIYVAAVIIFFVFIVLQLTRQLILWTALVSIYYIFKKSKKLIITCMAFVCIGYTFIGNIKLSEDSILGSMVALTIKQNKENQYINEEDIRITEYKYFMGDFSKNIITDIIGNGMPHFDSSYGKSYWIRDQEKGLYLSDVGYAKMYAVNGLIGLCLYLFLFIYSLRKRIPKQLAYCKLFILFMIPANIAASWYSTVDGQIAVSICIYLMYLT